MIGYDKINCRYIIVRVREDTTLYLTPPRAALPGQDKSRDSQQTHRDEDPYYSSPPPAALCPHARSALRSVALVAHPLVRGRALREAAAGQ